MWIPLVVLFTIFTLVRSDYEELKGALSRGDVPKLCQHTKKSTLSTPSGRYKLAISASPEFGGECRPDDFQILSKLARGGYGQVALVKHQPTGQLYAMKVFVSTSPSRYSMIRNEECHHHMLHHPLIARFYCSMRVDRSTRLLVDYIDGETLHDVVTGMKGEKAKVGFGQMDARRAVAQLIVAIEYCHATGLVFGDLTSRNVMVNREGNLRLIDLGFSKLIGAQKDEPPAFPNGPRQPTFSQNPYIDWYAIGYMLLEILYGEKLQKEGVKASEIKTKVERKAMAGIDCLRLIGDKEACDLFRRFAKVPWKKALGLSAASRKAIRDHPYFEGFDWNSVVQ